MSRAGRVALERMHLLLGSFYRDRAGYKYVCFSIEERDGVPRYYCLRIHQQTTVVFSAAGAPAFEGYDELTLVEEVQPDSPEFVDPTACVEGINYDTMWERVQVMPSGIEIVKFSPKTATRDLLTANKDIPSDIRNKLDRHNIGKLWRVRLNKQTRARYEWDIDKAVALVMSRVEVTDD